MDSGFVSQLDLNSSQNEGEPVAQPSDSEVELQNFTTHLDPEDLNATKHTDIQVQVTDINASDNESPTQSENGSKTSENPQNYPVKNENTDTNPVNSILTNSASSSSMNITRSKTTTFDGPEISIVSVPPDIIQDTRRRSSFNIIQSRRASKQRSGSLAWSKWFGGDSVSLRRPSQWSIISLRREFVEANIEDMYQKYWLRLQRNLLFKLLLIIAFYGVGVLFLYNVVGNIRSTEERIRISVTYGVLSAVAVILSVFVFIHRIYNKIYRVLTIFIWLFLVGMLFMPIPFQNNVTGMENVPFAFYVIFVIHTMLPTSRRVSTTLGMLTGLADLIIVGVLYQPEEDLPSSWKWNQLLANILIYLCSNFTGLYLKHFTDLAHRETFLDTRRFIEADIKFSREREKQAQFKENLLRKIIPNHLLEEMKKIMNEKLRAVETQDVPRRMFHQLLVERHDNVSILYADIVSFTPLTATLAPSELVRALNELFGTFDELSQKNNCMRIKILGDAYYCVSGLPDPIPDHGRNCVIMGMQMIKVIRHIRNETSVDTLDMRIGVHTGWVLSGVVGLKKWQYDVWSDEVSTANHMESGGVPGRLHVPRETLAELKGEFEVEDGHGKDRDSYLKENEVDPTYLIAEKELAKVNINDFLTKKRQSVIRKRSSEINTLDTLKENETQSPKTLNPAGSPLSEPTTPRQLSRMRLKRRFSMADVMDGWGAETPFHSLSDYLIEKTLPETTEINTRLEQAFDLNPNGGQSDGSWGMKNLTPSNEINIFTLRFKDSETERNYKNRQDRVFKYYVIWAFVMFAFMTAVQVIALKRSVELFVSMAVGFLVYGTLLVLTTGLSCLPFHNYYLYKMENLSRSITTQAWLKVFISFVSAATMFVSTIVPVNDCQYLNEDLTGNLSDGEVYLMTRSSGGGIMNETDEGNSTIVTEEDLPCLFAPYYLFCCMIALISCSVFLRLSYLWKSLYMVIGLVIFNNMFYNVFDDIFRIYDIYLENAFIDSNVRGSYFTFVLFITLVVLDRQIEVHMRLDFLYKTNLEKKKLEVRTNAQLNELLLGNILPKHVADHFLHSKRVKQEMYSKTYKNASVMFAAIPNFKAFFSSVDVTGIECLRLLNEIISEFDTLLLLRRSIGVEKIKTIGSTYMAASGLNIDDDTEKNDAKSANNVRVMTDFALALMAKLEELSKDAFYPYKLRIGLNHGEVIAGVVGAQKPIYDIWGDCVNVASRMESHGVMDRIQMPESTMKLAYQVGISCDYRDTIDIKGKGPMKLYLVSPRNLSRVNSFLANEDVPTDIYCL